MKGVLDTENWHRWINAITARWRTLAAGEMSVERRR
jgi:hypothetical protein